jgi:hypothetical protein
VERHLLINERSTPSSSLCYTYLEERVTTDERTEEDQNVLSPRGPSEHVRIENQREEIESERAENGSNDAMVDFSTEDTEGDQLKIVYEVTEKEGAETDGVEIGVPFQVKFIHPTGTEHQSQEGDDDPCSTRRRDAR